MGKNIDQCKRVKAFVLTLRLFGWLFAEQFIEHLIQVEVPVEVWRPAVAGQAAGILPLFAAARASAAGGESIPLMAALRLADPARMRLGFPVAFWAGDLDSLDHGFRY